MPPPHKKKNNMCTRIFVVGLKWQLPIKFFFLVECHVVLYDDKRVKRPIDTYLVERPHTAPVDTTYRATPQPTASNTCGSGASVCIV